MSEPYERRYTYGGRFAHLFSPRTDFTGYPYMQAFCGYSPRLFVAWLGTGDQNEYDRAQALPVCRQCAGIAADKQQLVSLDITRLGNRRHPTEGTP